MSKVKKIIFIAAGVLIMAAAIIITAVIAVNVTNKKNEEAAAAVLSRALEENARQSPDNSGIVKEEIILDKDTLEEIIKPAAELVTMKYYYTNAAEIENYKTIFDFKVPLTTDHVVFKYDGVILAGVDLNEIVFDNIDNESKKIYITMPMPEVISNDPDLSSFSYYNVKDSIFTSISPSEITGKLDELKRTQEAECWAKKDFWDSVVKNAEDTVERFIKVSDEAKDYDVIFE